jgi:hypothetical protein
MSGMGGENEKVKVKKKVKGKGEVGWKRKEQAQRQ